ncbi:DUF2171 domain-containing protein [Sphingomonas sp. MMS12-HWE2-04]|uniref:DUF2171 domain-containing protein n=1 Tax=Sphingomonas sp. MMS12-HWE2-04 TaxID=3234199 RepID=UPI00384DE21A
MDDRNRPYGPRDSYGRDADYTEDYGSGRDYTYSSARDYAAAGELGGRRERGNYGYGADAPRDRARYGYGAGGYGPGNYGPGERGGWDRERGQQRGYGARSFGGRVPERSFERDRGYDRDRGFIDRAGDEIRSWFGDEEAERRRELDQRHDEQQYRAERGRDASGRDDHYHAWRRERIGELDRDYEEYRQENAQRFQNEFTSWRSDRQGQRDSLRRVAEHMEVVGSDDTHVGTVDKVRGDRILLTKSDSAAGNHHHSIPSRWIQSVDDKVVLRKTAEEAKAHWRDEERGALFGDTRGEDETSWRTERNLDRSFKGTY